MDTSGRSTSATGAGKGLPVETISMRLMPASRVSGRAVPNCNSSTVPTTRTKSPTAGTGISTPKSPTATKMPSDVVKSPSPAGSCNQKLRPSAVNKVTTPLVSTTSFSNAEYCPSPWISETLATSGLQPSRPPAVGVLSAPRKKSAMTQSSTPSVSTPSTARRTPAGKKSPSGPITGAAKKNSSPTSPSVSATVSRTTSPPVTASPLKESVATSATVSEEFSKKSVAMDLSGVTP